MNDEQMRPLLEVWLRDRQIPPPRAQAGVAKVMANVPRTRRRSRWWPFPVFYRTVQTPTATDTTEYQPSPIPATDGHTPTVIGRTQTMFSPSKALIAGALVFGIGGVMLIAQPFGQQANVPGAETEAIAPTWVTGTIQAAPSCSEPEPLVDGDVIHGRTGECSPQAWTSSDPHLTGEVSWRWNQDTHQTDEGSITVYRTVAYLRNDDGGWACSNSSVYQDSEDTSAPETYTCVGDGGYGGLSAVLVLGPSGSATFSGLMFSGDLPPAPEPPAAE